MSGVAKARLRFADVVVPPWTHQGFRSALPTGTTLLSDSTRRRRQRQVLTGVHFDLLWDVTIRYKP
jgi:hypothetical protein